MKDSYTLDRDQAGLDEGYAKHEEAYDRIYTRCGLDFYKVESDTGHHGREPGARVHGALERGRGPRRALQQVRLRRERRDGRLAHRARAVPAERSRRRGRDAQRGDDRGAGAVPRHRCAHDRQGDAGRRPPTARSGSRSCAATAACTSSSSARCCARPPSPRRPSRSRRRSAPSRARSGRSASAPARSADRRRRDAARGLLGDRRQPHRLASHRRRGAARLRGARSPTSTRSRRATAARCATACSRSSR